MVSMFTDIASEMLYPVMPMFLKSIGFSILLIGLLEGFAEAVAGFSKGYFGKMSDLSGKRLPFVKFGYFLSAVSKPMMAAFAMPAWIFLARTIDRIGKGVRTGARDALLSAETTPEHKGKVFGFHRGLDTLGAFIGPILALIFLHFYPENYSLLFIIAFIPGVLAVMLTFIIKEKAFSVKENNENGKSFFSFLSYLKESSKEYKRLITGLLLFALINSSDVFLLLLMKYKGLGDSDIIKIYIFYNLVYSICAFPVGVAADKLGLKKIFMIGIFIFSGVYFGMVLSDSLLEYYVLFALYGLYAACTEGVSKAWISNISKKEKLATAIGTYEAFRSIAAMLASSIAGFIWYTSGATTTFVFSSVGAILVVMYMITVPYRTH